MRLLITLVVSLPRAHQGAIINTWWTDVVEVSPDTDFERVITDCVMNRLRNYPSSHVGNERPNVLSISHTVLPE